MIQTPRELVELNLKEADECSKLAERLNELENLFDLWWDTQREEHKSDASTERAWGRTKEGQEMRGIKRKIKSKERKISARKSYLRVLEQEAHNQY